MISNQIRITEPLAKDKKQTSIRFGVIGIYLIWVIQKFSRCVRNTQFTNFFITFWMISFDTNADAKTKMLKQKQKTWFRNLTVYGSTSTEQHGT